MARLCLRPLARISRIPKSALSIWSEARSAWAAIVSAGFTAADDGRNEASIKNKFLWSWLRQNGSNADVAGSVPKRIVPHWCDVECFKRGFVNTIGYPQALNNDAIFFTSWVWTFRLFRRVASWIIPPFKTTRLSGSGRSSENAIQSML